MASRAAPSPAVRILVALVCIGSGLLPVLASLDIGPLDSGAINGPPWLGFLAGAIFIAGGIALMLGTRWRTGALAAGLVALVVGAFAAIANWIAFGPGPRECAIGVAGLFFAAGSGANEIACRAGFGMGALLLDGIVLWMIAHALRLLLGAGALPTFVQKAGVALLLIALAPVIVPILLCGIARSFFESVSTWRATGRWPRNEAFIRRMNAKRARQR
jgi:hypothetical protein